MPKRNRGLLVAYFAALLGFGCSQTQPTPRDFTLVDQRPAKALETHNTLAEAETACKQQTETQGMKSIKAIFSHLRKGAADADYIACMKERGYEVKQ
jgi:hypothetical protein